MKLNCCKVAKKTGNWKDNDCSPEISSFFTGPRMKTNSQRDGDVWGEEIWTKSRRESKLLEIFCFLSSKYWAERGRGDSNYSRDLILDMWHRAALHITQPCPRLGLVTVSVTRVTRDGDWEPVIKIEKKIQNLIRVRHDILFMMKCVTYTMYEAGVFILHYIKVCCWYCDIQYPCERFALRFCNQSGWLDDLSAE